eukprot:PhM_4_TR2274/c0_g1_i1/m.26352
MEMLDLLHGTTHALLLLTLFGVSLACAGERLALVIGQKASTPTEQLARIFLLSSLTAPLVTAALVGLALPFYDVHTRRVIVVLSMLGGLGLDMLSGTYSGDMADVATLYAVAVLPSARDVLVLSCLHVGVCSLAMATSAVSLPSSSRLIQCVVLRVALVFCSMWLTVPREQPPIPKNAGCTTKFTPPSQREAAPLVAAAATAASS